MKVSVIMPTMGRPTQAYQVVRRLQETCQGQDVEIIAVVECDPETSEMLGAISGPRVISRAEHRGAIYGWNEGAQRATGDVLVLAADDLEWPDGWLARALNYLVRADFVGFNDGHRDGDSEGATHFMATRRHLIEVQGGVLAIPVYGHYGFDYEMTRRAQRAGRYVWARDLPIPHRHPQWRTALWDATYQASLQWRVADRELFYRREAAGFPNDYESVLSTDERCR
jgi:glycosyltransferase involved in cell wall biosynthesis